MILTCRNCGMSLQPDSDACHECGTKLPRA
ncbi:zinc-ribbon domain-containing protein, partial [Candidatus Eisenbacteria bacterium]